MCEKINLLVLPMIFVTTFVNASGFPQFETPDFMHSTIISDGMVFNGMKMRAYEFRSTKNAEEIETYYQNYWRGKVKQTKAGGMNILSHYDGEYLFVVQIEDSGEEKVNGLLSISFPQSFKGNHKPGKGFPMLHSSVVINDIKSVDLGKRSRTLLINNTRSTSTNLKYYRKYFLQKGWAERIFSNQPSSNKIGDVNVLMMNKGRNELNMSFNRKGGKTTIVAVMVEQ